MRCILAVRVLFGSLVLCGLALSSAQAQWGTLKVKFVYDGAPPAAQNLKPDKDVEVCGKVQLVDESLLVGSDGGIANVVLYVTTKGVKVHPDYDKTANDKVESDNSGCRFVPHIMTLRLSQPLVLKNTDPVAHNTNLQPPGDTAINPLIPGGGAADYKFNRAANVPVPVSCNIHPWMKGYFLPRDNPYAAVSKADGTVELKNLPVGEIELRCWHENQGYLAAKSDWVKGKFTLTIKEGDNDLGAIKVSPDLLKKK